MCYNVIRTTLKKSGQKLSRVCPLRGNHFRLSDVREKDFILPPGISVPATYTLHPSWQEQALFNIYVFDTDISKLDSTVVSLHASGLTY